MIWNSVEDISGWRACALFNWKCFCPDCRQITITTLSRCSVCNKLLVYLTSYEEDRGKIYDPDGHEICRCLKVKLKGMFPTQNEWFLVVKDKEGKARVKRYYDYKTITVKSK